MSRQNFLFLDLGLQRAMSAKIHCPIFHHGRQVQCCDVFVVYRYSIATVVTNKTDTKVFQKWFGTVRYQYRQVPVPLPYLVL